MKEEALRQIGLNDKEIKIYLSNLRLGSALVQDIVHSAKLNRTSTYDILASLEKKGLVSYTLTSGKKFYQATNPNKILHILKEKENLIKKALPELQAIKESIPQKPSVETYIGINGIKTIFDDILTSKTFDVIASKKQLLKLFKYYFPHFVKKRIKLGIKPRIIGDDIPLDKNTNYKLIKKPIKTATFLYNEKIAMISLEEKEPIGILIKEKNFYETNKLMFDLLWDNL